MRKVMALLVTLAMLMLSVGAAAAQSLPSQAPVDPIEGCNYYEETGHNLCDTFLAYWESNGGLPVFGYPITEEYEEENLDTGETYTVQYFERERFEYHPENAGTVYEVLLGRLGNEVLLQQGRDWQTFEKSDSSEANYIDVTGFAVAPEFIDYWSSHGLDFDEPGFSFRESLALFGYPISQAEMETNANGDTVLTQWFERARFEFHPDNPEGQQVLLGLLGVEVLDEEPEPPPPAEPDFTVIVDGLDNPRHISAGPDGALYVAEAGVGGDECVSPDPEDPEFMLCFGNTGSIIRIVDGEEQVVADGLPSYWFGEGDATGVHDVAVGADGTIYAVIGLDASAEEREMIGSAITSVDAIGSFGHLVQINPDGSWTSIADLAAYEAANNTDQFIDELFGGQPDLYSNPYALLVVDDGWLVVDAGANALLHVDAEGTITPVAVFPPQMVDIPEDVEVPPGVPTDIQIPMQSVPTSIAVGLDGAYYVGELTGYPFIEDTARVWRVVPGEDPTVHATGFTNIGDIAFDGEGNLYVLEIVEAGIRAAEAVIFGGEGDITDFPGAIVKVDQEGNHTAVASNGLIFPTGMTITADGSIYVSNWGIMPGMGQVVLLDETAAPQSPPPDFTVVAEGLNNPRHISVGGDGALYVAEAGDGGDECVTVGEGEETFELCFGLSGAVTRIADGEVEQVATGLPSAGGSGPHDVVVTAEGEIYVLFGLGGPPEGRDLFEAEEVAAVGTLVRLEDDGTWTIIADVAAHEGTNNPDPPVVDTNPYAMIMDGENFIVADAGGNSLLQVTPDGEITTLAVFPPITAEAGETVPESVPTTVVKGPDGAYYVGELTGEPTVLDAARVWRVVPGEDPEVYATGFTAIGAIDFDSEGNLYVLEILAAGFSEDAPPLSAVIKVAPDGTQTAIPSGGLVFATGLAITADDSIYVVNQAVFPGEGQVVLLNGEAETEE